MVKKFHVNFASTKRPYETTTTGSSGSSSSSSATLKSSAAVAEKPSIMAFTKKSKTITTETKSNGTHTSSLPVSIVSENVRLNEQHLDPRSITQYSKIFQQGAPFPHIHIKNLLPSILLHQVKEELLQADYMMKRNDLYDFLQTDDLRKMKNNASAKLRDYIYSTEFRNWIERITGVETTDTIDLSAAMYNTGSHLLCHDDDLAARRIAYIIYLVPENWTKEDGGSLDLYNTTDDGMPDSITARLIPCWNSIAFFEVSPVSFHQVAEVTTFTPEQANKGSRMSISGWFHGKPGKRPPMPILPIPNFVVPSPHHNDKDNSSTANNNPTKSWSKSKEDNALDNVQHALPLQKYASLSSSSSSSSIVPKEDILSLTYWISPVYLKRTTMQQMYTSYISNASLQLDKFLRPEIYREVRKALGVQRWKHIGPPILYSYRRLDWNDSTNGTTSSTTSLSSQYNSCLPDILHQLYTFLTSAVFYDYIATLTGTTLNGVTGEIRAFAEGDYSLLSDPAYQQGLKAAKANRIGVNHTNNQTNGKNGNKSLSSSANDDNGDDDENNNNNKQDSVPLLDVTFCCTGEENDTEWTDDKGGWITYMTADDELLTVSPKHNSITIVCK